MIFWKQQSYDKKINSYQGLEREGKIRIGHRDLGGSENTLYGLIMMNI